MNYISYIEYSLSEIPHQATLIVYTYGCKLGCSYCYNRDLWSVDKNNSFGNRYVIEHIAIYNSRIRFVTAVSISGAEPLVHNIEVAKLVNLIKQFDSGLLVSIDTSLTQGILTPDILYYTDRYCISVKEDKYTTKYSKDIEENLKLLQTTNAEICLNCVFTNDNKEHLLSKTHVYVNKLKDRISYIRISPAVVTKTNSRYFNPINKEQYQNVIEQYQKKFKGINLKIIDF